MALCVCQGLIHKLSELSVSPQRPLHRSEAPGPRTTQGRAWAGPGRCARQGQPPSDSGGPVRDRGGGEPCGGVADSGRSEDQPLSLAGAVAVQRVGVCAAGPLRGPLKGGCCAPRTVSPAAPRRHVRTTKCHESTELTGPVPGDRQPLRRSLMYHHVRGHCVSLAGLGAGDSTVETWGSGPGGRLASLR